MDYYKILNLNKEPFSNSPDPEFFFESSQHVGCLQKLELSIRLRRGLNVVIGDVGTGKTTLCRQLIRKFAGEKDKVETNLLLDPGFTSPAEFLSAIAVMFGESVPEPLATEWQLKERIKNYLFRRGVDEKKIVILIIDEGQKIPEFCLEILREFLNYETNEHKLLQVVLFAQKEFDERIKKHTNFADRINLYFYLGPLNFRETRLMICFRLDKARGSELSPNLFSLIGLWAVFNITGGYPRKIVHLCNKVLLALIIQNRTRAGWLLVRSTAQRSSSLQFKWWRPAAISTCLVILVFLLVLGYKQVGPYRGTKDSDIVIASPVKKLDEKARIKISPEKDPPLNDNPRISKIYSSEKEIIDISLKPSSASFQGFIQKKDVELNHGMVEVAPPTSHASDISAESKKTGNAISQALNEKIPVINGYPEHLGQLTVEKQDTVSDMIHKVYGVFNYKYLASVVEANQSIGNINFLSIGDSLNFPAIELEDSSFFSEGFWVQLTQKKDLKEAYQFVKNYSDNASPIQIVPYWDEKLSLNFPVLLNKVFNDESSALKGLALIPPKFKSEAKILTHWDKGTAFFASLN